MRAVNQPESWWGWHGYNQPQPLSITQVLQSGTMPPRLAAVFWLGLERGASFVFAADPPGAGKTTILTALLAFAPPETVAYFTRGWGETFDLPPRSNEYPTYVMVNEMSDHLPVYSWGPYVVRVFELLAGGYSLCTTMHADDAEGVVEQLAGEVGVPRDNIGRLTFIVPLAIGHREGRPLRRVLDVTVPVANGDLALRRIARWDERNDAFSLLERPDERAALAAKLGIAEGDLDGELDRREAFLRGLVEQEVTGISAVQEAIDGFRRAGRPGAAT